MNIAIVHDWLSEFAGADKVLLELLILVDKIVSIFNLEMVVLQLLEQQPMQFMQP